MDETAPPETPATPPDNPLAQHAALANRIRAEVGRVVVGQEDAITHVVAALLAGGHVLLEGVPGLGKTLLVLALSRTFGGQFSRVQFTPDLMPSDVTGHAMFEGASGEFVVRKGPAFTNLLLTDEINRAPAKTQAALLEVMQEGQITIEGESYPLPPPFMVLATQNPIEQEGTYPLPEAQVDRFMLKLEVGYPTRDEEKEILRRSMAGFPELSPVLSPEHLLHARSVAARVRFDDKLVDYVLDLVMATRAPSEHGLSDLAPLIDFGASPRATINLQKAARAHALLAGRSYVSSSDIKAVAPDVLRHRVVLSYEAEAEEIDANRVVDRILATVPVP